MPDHPTRRPVWWASSAARAALVAALATRPRGLFSDVDGTLSEIAPTPEQARLAPGAVEALRAASRSFAIVGLISGRDPRSLWRMARVDGLVYVGNHGFETLAPTSSEEATTPETAPETAPEAAPWRPVVSETLATLRAELTESLPGAIFEDKGVTASIHVRMTPDPDAAERLALVAARRVARRVGLRVTRGRRIVELRPPLAVDKGVALTRLCHERGLRGAIYLGDDQTDLDAFHALRTMVAADPAFHGVSVAVTRARPAGAADSAADTPLNPAAARVLRAADIAVAGVAAAVELVAWLATVNEGGADR